jgi:hypothetical protein
VSIHQQAPSTWRNSVPELFRHSVAQLLVGDVQIPLRRLQVCVTEQQLDCAKVQTFRQPSARRLVPEVVPMEIDFGDMLAIDSAVCACARRLEAVRQQVVRNILIEEERHALGSCIWSATRSSISAR